MTSKLSVWDKKQMGGESNVTWPPEFCAGDLFLLLTSFWDKQICASISAVCTQFRRAGIIHRRNDWNKQPLFGVPIFLFLDGLYINNGDVITHSAANLRHLREIKTYSPFKPMELPALRHLTATHLLICQHEMYKQLYWLNVTYSFCGAKILPPEMPLLTVFILENNHLPASSCSCAFPNMPALQYLAVTGITFKEYALSETIIHFSFNRCHGIIHSKRPATLARRNVGGRILRAPFMVELSPNNTLVTEA